MAFEEGSISNNLFTADLNENTPGTIDFGIIDESKYTGTIHYTP